MYFLFFLLAGTPSTASLHSLLREMPIQFTFAKTIEGAELVRPWKKTQIVVVMNGVFVPPRKDFSEFYFKKHMGTKRFEKILGQDLQQHYFEKNITSTGVRYLEKGAPIPFSPGIDRVIAVEEWSFQDVMAESKDPYVKVPVLYVKCTLKGSLYQSDGKRLSSWESFGYMDGHKPKRAIEKASNLAIYNFVLASMGRISPHRREEL